MKAKSFAGRGFARVWLSPLSSLRDLAGHIKFIVFCEYECNPFLFFFVLRAWQSANCETFPETRWRPKLYFFSFGVLSLSKNLLGAPVDDFCQNSISHSLKAEINKIFKKT